MNILRAGQPQRKQLDAIQQQISALQKDISATEKAPLSLDEARDSLRAALKREIASDRDNPEYRLGQFRRRFGKYDIRPELPVLGYGVLALVMGEDKLLKALTAPLTAHDAARPGISTVDAEKQLATMRSKLRDLEEKEEYEILKLEEDRWTVIRRGDADPKLLLEIWLAHRPETVSDVPAEPFGFKVPVHVNAGTGGPAAAA